MKKDIHATIAEPSLKFTLKALNDRYIVEEDPVDYEVDVKSGLTPAVVNALKSGIIELPDGAEYFAKKFPCTGIVLSKGSKCKLPILVGDRIAYERLGVMRFKWEGREVAVVVEWSVHGLKS